jgi:WD40 repeat protein
VGESPVPLCRTARWNRCASVGAADRAGCHLARRRRIRRESADLGRRDGSKEAVLAGHSSLVLTLATAPDSTWLASAGYDGTVPIRGTTTWQVQALMRTDAEISTCAWLGSSALALAGKEAGLYLFSFTGT